MRIAGLVLAIKGFTHMDQATVAEPVDLAPEPRQHGRRSEVEGAGEVGRRVRRAWNPDLPRVRGFAGELNQIWANLIDNALDAVPESGRVEVRGRAASGSASSCAIVDNGPGIPAEIRERIFDPFFTTKPVGAGHRPGPRHRPAARPATTTARSPSSRSRAGRSFGSRCRSPRPRAPKARP